MLSFLLLVTFALTAYSQNFVGPIAKPTVGYGADGRHTIAIDSIDNPGYPGHNIVITYPSDITGKVPTVFYCHAFSAEDPEIVRGLLDFIAKKGFAAVFVPYPTTGSSIQERYDNLINGFLLSARNFPDIIDTARVGFMGWSFGGGAVFGVAHKLFTQYNWGQDGRFIYALAQWYSHNMTSVELGSFPENTKLLIQVFENDSVNDHRMAVDIFNHIGIPDSAKDYVMLKDDSVSGYHYISDHTTPNTGILHNGRFDAYDYYGIYRLLDAMCAYVFSKNKDAKTVALGNGSPEQIGMPGGLKSLDVTHEPVAYHDESSYGFPCSNVLNPREEYCSGTSTEKGSIKNNPSCKTSLSLSPNPFNLVTTIAYNLPAEGLVSIKVFDIKGKRVATVLTGLKQTGMNSISWNGKNNEGTEVSAGIYLLQAKLGGQSFTKRLFVE